MMRSQKDRRRAPRVPATVPVRVRVQMHEVGRPGVDYVFSRDLSEAGMFIITEQPTKAGTRVELLFDLPGVEKNVQAAGIVRRVVPRSAGGEEPGLGIEFATLTSGADKAIKLFITQRLRVR